MPEAAILNERSLDSVSTPQAMTECFVRLARVYKTSFRLGLRTLRTENDFRNHLIDGVRIEDIIQGLPSDSRPLVLSILDSPYVSGVIDEFAERSIILRQVTAIDDTPMSSDGVLCALALGKIAFSFESDKKWKCAFLRVTTIDEINWERVHKVPHVSNPENVLTHFDWLVDRLGVPQIPPTTTNPLPRTEVSNLLVKNDWNQFYESMKTLPTAEKIARLRQIAPSVAMANGFKRDPKLSKLNSSNKRLRQIFCSDLGRARVFLSTDFETPAGAFEVLDHGGRHVGEFLFSGRKNGEADPSGKHDIRLQ